MHFLLTALATLAHAQGPRVSYQLHARLDVERHEIHGRGVVILDNASTATLSELQWHLYLNAFKNDSSLFYRSATQRARGGTAPTHWGGIDIERLSVQGDDYDLWQDAAPHSPGDPLDTTSIAVPLQVPLGPSEQLRLDVRWVSRLPDLVDRTGYAGSLHFAGQWFPKLAKLEDDGTWSSFSFHPHGEFYANFGDYDVVIDVPAEYVVGASGTRQPSAPAAAEDRATHRFLAPRVIDFAWVAWPHFERLEHRHDGVALEILYPPGHDHNAQLTLDALRLGLDYFGRRFGAYPYPSLTAVHPPTSAAAAGGMEYPTLITTGGPWYAGWFSKAVEQVTLHELAHQWFYALCASNEQRYPFLDEGLTSYADSQALSARYGAGSGLELPYFDVSALAYYRLLAAARAGESPIALPAREFPDFGALGAIVYGRTATLLNTWERVYGQRVAEALNRYARQCRFSHPTPEDLIRVLVDELGPEHSSMLRSALFERAWVDYEVKNVSSRPSLPARGAPLTSSLPPRPAHVGGVLVVRRGNLEFPVDIELHDAVGNVHYRHWDGRGEYIQLDYQGDEPLVSAVVDPEFRVLLDQDLTNNARSTAAPASPRTEGLFTLAAQLLLHLIGS